MTKHDRLEPRRSDISNTKDNEAAGSSDWCEFVTPKVDKQMTIVHVDESESEEDTSYGWSVDDSIFDYWTDRLHGGVRNQSQDTGQGIGCNSLHI